GPLLSSVLTDDLIGDGLSKESARKRISRALAAQAITRVPLDLPHNNHLLHLPEQYNTPGYWERLEEAIRASGSAYGAAFDAIASRGGAVRRPLFSTFSGSPISQKGHIPAEVALNNLIANRVLQELPFDQHSTIIALGVPYGSMFATSKRFRSVE